MENQIHAVCRNCWEKVPADKWYVEAPVARCICCGSKICPDCGENVPEDREPNEFPCFCWEQAEAEQSAYIDENICRGCYNHKDDCDCED